MSGTRDRRSFFHKRWLSAARDFIDECKTANCALYIILWAALFQNFSFLLQDENSHLLPLHKIFFVSPMRALCYLCEHEMNASLMLHYSEVSTELIAACYFQQ